MSTIPGSGTQDDPYVVSTWADLVEKAAVSGVYIKLGDDIDVLAEYPDGDMPTLVNIANIDGDGKTISRMYKTSENYCIMFSPSYNGLIENVNFTNINTNYSLIKNHAPQASHINIKNCKFAGRIKSGRVLNRTDSYYSGRVINSSFNIKGNVTFCSDNGVQTHENCYIKLDTTANHLVHQNSYYATTFVNCYLEVNGPNLTEFGDEASTLVAFDNSALDITTPNNVPFRATATGISIFNQTHAPLMAEARNIKAVLNGDWTNVSALQAVGFDIVEVAE